MRKNPEPISQEQVIKVAEKIKPNLHKVWQEGYHKDLMKEGKPKDTKRPKPVPEKAFKEGETAIQAKERFEGMGLGGFEVKDNKLQQNINTEANKLVPELNEKLNGGPAVKYAEFVLEHSFENNIPSLEKGCDGIHKIWEDQNSWQKDFNPDSFKDFPDLSATLKIKDLDVLEIGIEAKGEMTQELQDVVNEYRSQLEAQIEKEVAQKQDGANDLSKMNVVGNLDQKPTEKQNVAKTTDPSTVKRPKI